MKLDKETLDWVIPLLQQVQAGGELRYRQDGYWMPLTWYGATWNSDQSYYRVLMPWAWELVDAEAAGKVIEHASSIDSNDNMGGWKQASSSDLRFDDIKRFWRIKPSEPARTPLTAEQMRGLVGKVADCSNTTTTSLTWLKEVGVLDIDGTTYDAKELMHSGWTFNGKNPWNETDG